MQFRNPGPLPVPQGYHGQLDGYHGPLPVEPLATCVPSHLESRAWNAVQSGDANGLQEAQAEVVLFSHWEGKEKAGRTVMG